MKTDSHPLLKFVYGLAAVIALFTGFGNMPLWKRYYVADIPGLGWSGDFLINLNVHILAGSILVALAGYAALTSRMDRRPPTTRRPLSGKVGAMQPGLALAAGIVMVVKNLPGVHLPLYALVAFNLAHMGAAVLFMIAAAIALIFRRPWRLIA